MKTILNIDQSQIQVLNIRGKHKKYSTVELQPGTVLNGVILDADKLEAALLEAKGKAKKVTIIIDSSNILSKKLTLPKVSKAKRLQMVKGEFDLMYTEQDYQYDTNVLTTGNPATVMAYAVSQELIDTYLQVCKRCKLKVERVEFLINGLINYINKQRAFQGKTFLFNLVCGDHLLSLLFENGEYQLSNRIRLLHVGEGELFYQELYSRLSAMIQFSTASRSTYTIADSYYIGITQEEVQGLTQYVEGMVPVKVQAYQDVAWKMSYFLPALAAYGNKQDINFAIKYQERIQRGQKRRGIALKTLFLLSVMGLLGGHSWLIWQDYQAACAVYDQTDAVVNDVTRLEGLARCTALQTENALLLGEIDQYNNLFALLDSGAVVERQVLEQVFEGDAIDSFDFAFESGQVNIQGTLPTHALATEYAARLREKGFFVTMDYEGYREGAKEGWKPASYRFTITAGYAPVMEAPEKEGAAK